MLYCVRSRRIGRAFICFALAAFVTVEAGAIEMFTYFGDGSRIGLPSLEVPIEAYPGIPLRSDRLRARRRAMRMGTGSGQGVARGPSKTITIRAMPEAVAAPVARPATPPSVRGKPAPAATEEIPVAPEPDAIQPEDEPTSKP